MPLTIHCEPGVKERLAELAAGATERKLTSLSGIGNALLKRANPLAYDRLSRLMGELIGLQISEGAIANALPVPSHELVEHVAAARSLTSTHFPRHPRVERVGRKAGAGLVTADNLSLAQPRRDHLAGSGERLDSLTQRPPNSRKSE